MHHAVIEVSDNHELESGQVGAVFHISFARQTIRSVELSERNHSKK
jgi:hypothetical protein